MARGGKKDGDPLKMYTIVMSLLVVVMAVLYFVIDTKRKVYVEANKRAEKYMTGKGLPATLDDSPRTVPDMALTVERLSHTYEQAAGGTDLGKRGISLAFMNNAATIVGLRQIYASRERVAPNKTKGYETTTQNFEYEAMAGGPPEVWRVLSMLYNIESQSRYRVSEVSWTVADQKANPTPPFDKVKKPRITVALRLPTLE